MSLSYAQVPQPGTSSEKTRAEMSFASRATPLDAVPRPAAMPATWVPCAQSRRARTAHRSRRPCSTVLPPGQSPAL